jgi:hypothetical protein
MLKQTCGLTIGSCLTALFFCPSQSIATRYEIVAPSSYLYLGSPEGPGVAGCQPDSFRCEFSISGSFEFETNVSAGEGQLQAANIVLTGNEGAAHSPAIAAAVLESVLMNSISPLPIESGAGGSFLFREPVPLSPAIRWNSVEVLITENHLSLTGAFDRTFADGAGHEFNVVAIAVPEPASAVLIASFLIAMISKYQRIRSD